MKPFATLMTLFLFAFSLSLNAQSQIGEWLELSEEKTRDGRIALSASNTGLAPLTISLDFKVLKNFKANVDLPHLFVVHPGKTVDVLELSLSRRSGTGAYEYQFGFFLGDCLNTEYDTDFEYLLPFPEKKTYFCGQGYNGKFSHAGLYCLDFDMPVGDKVTAARGGVVIDIKEDSKRGCKSSKCQQDGNYIVIYHEDGTFGNYVHLEFNGVAVEIGDVIEPGQHIGYSGNTGWSSGPHLHFEVFRTEFNKRISLPTKFKIGKNKVGEIEERQKYTAYH